MALALASKITGPGFENAGLKPVPGGITKLSV